MTYISWSSDSVLNLDDYLMAECCTGDTQDVKWEHPCTSDTFLLTICETSDIRHISNYNFAKPHLIFKMASCKPAMLKYSVVHNFLNSPLILIKFLSKFMVCEFLYFEAQHALRLRSPLIAGVLSWVKMNAIDFLFKSFTFWKCYIGCPTSVSVLKYVHSSKSRLFMLVLIPYYSILLQNVMTEIRTW